MSAELLDGCPTCGNRAGTSQEHREQCALLNVARGHAKDVGLAYAVSHPRVDDLFAHLVTPRAGGPWCTPETAALIVRCVVELGWRPVVGVTA